MQNDLKGVEEKVSERLSIKEKFLKQIVPPAVRPSSLDGLVEMHDGEGRLLSSITYDQGVKEGPGRIYDDGHVVMTLHHHKNQIHGLVTIYDNDLPLVKITYMHDQRHGPAEFLDASGRVMVRQHFVNDVHQGECLHFYPTERLQAKMFYDRGKMHGLASYYYEPKHPDDPDVLMREAMYEKGVQHGHEKLFFPNGRLMTESSYDQGRLHGAQITYYMDGAVQTIARYDHGFVVDKPIHYDPQGHKIVDPLE